MPVKFNLKRDPNGGLPPQGIFRFLVTDVKEGTATEAGKFDYISLTVKQVVNGQPKGLGASYFMSLDPEKRWQVDRFLDAVGAPNSDEEIGANWFRGKSGWAEFKNYTGNDGVNRSGITPLSEKDAENRIRKAELAAERGESAESSVRRGTRPAVRGDENDAPRQRKRQAEPVAVAELDDDVPF